MQDEELKKLMDTVRRLSDIEEIRSLRDRYHHFVNEGKFGRRIKRTTVTLFFSVPFQQGWADTEVQAFDMRETVADGAAMRSRGGASF
jgi:hypothetical protein